MYQLISSLKVMPCSKTIKDRFLTSSLVDRKVTASCDFSSGPIYREQDGINYCRGKQLLSVSFRIDHRSLVKRSSVTSGICELGVIIVA